MQQDRQTSDDWEIGVNVTIVAKRGRGECLLQAADCEHPGPPSEMELSLLSRQCLGDRRFATAMGTEITAWQTDRNTRHCGTNWRFTTPDARIKLKSLYPIPDIEG